MSLKEKIQQDFKTALKGKREIEVSTLRMLKAAILNKEKEKRYKIFQKEQNLTEKDLVEKSELSDEEIFELISSEIKKRKEAIFEFEKGKRLQPTLHPLREKHILDLVEGEKREMEILKKYLPEQLSEEEIKKLVKEVIKEVEATSVKDLGKVMGQLMPKVKGKAEGGLVSEIVKELLASKEK